MILGNFPQKNISLLASFVEDHNIFLDCRGELIIEEGTKWGYGVKVLTASHDPNRMPFEPVFKEWIPRSVIVRRLAWICSFALLYDCEIGEGALVGAGAVVKGVVIPPWTWVEGNPARPVGFFCEGEQRWVRGEKDVYLIRMRS